MAKAGEPDKRKFRREAHRVPCELRIGGRDHRGFVLDISARGLFVQTKATAPDGTEVQLVLRGPDRDPIHLTATVARIKASHRAVAVVKTGGLGLRVDSAPEDFFKLVMELVAKAPRGE